MNCDSVERENVIERYLAGTLEPELKDQWEEHFFGCERCSQQLETWCAIEQPLRDMQVSIRQEIRPPSPEPKRFSLKWMWTAATLAGALILAIVVWVGLARQLVEKPAVVSQAVRSSALVELARLDPPSYTPPAMRSIESKASTDFLEAMTFYQSHDYLRAITGLELALKEDPDAVPPRFFLGACYLLTNRPEPGIVELQKVVNGDSPFVDEARLYLAKGYLMQAKATEAAATLRPLADKQDDLGREARRIMDGLAAAR